MEKERLGSVGVALAIGAFLVLIVLPLLWPPVSILSNILGGIFGFFALELIAFVLGAVAWRTSAGKIAMVLSILITMLVVGWFTTSGGRMEEVRPLPGPSPTVSE